MEKHLSEEHKRKISEAKKGKHRSQETRRKISEANKGKHLSEETKRKIKLVRIGKYHSEETKKKISEKLANRYFSVESRKKMSESRKGKSPSDKIRQNISEKLKGRIPWNKGKHLPEETRKKMSLVHKGSKSYRWKGGITLLNLQIRSCFQYRQWRSDVFTKDDFTCQQCFQRGGQLETHHIISFSKIIEKNRIKTLEDALNCEELWNINNGITLCKKCHNNQRSTYGKNQSQRN